MLLHRLISASSGDPQFPAGGGKRIAGLASPLITRLNLAHPMINPRSDVGTSFIVVRDLKFHFAIQGTMG